MKYSAPVIDEKEQWVPIVVKNKDWLVGYVAGIQMVESAIIDSLEENGIEINLRGLDICLDSSRFNDIMESGKRESDCTKEEIKKYYQEIIENKINGVKEQHPDNESKVFSDCFFEVECGCGLGIYTFNNIEEVPSEQFKCQICGRVVIDYTNHEDFEYEYDGELTQRVEMIVEELNKKYQDQIDGDIEDYLE